MDDYQQSLREQLSRLPLTAPPTPWAHQETFAVGGLSEVGYAPDSDILLVISSQGRGLFNCLTGARIARDYQEDWEGLDEIRLCSPGIGDHASTIFRLAGLHGGGLPMLTHDGWGLEVVPLPWPSHFVFLTRPWMSIVDKGGHLKIATDGACELRACGFSETGRSFVVASSCDLMVFNRAIA